jgi:hypothetical protein
MLALALKILEMVYVGMSDLIPTFSSKSDNATADDRNVVRQSVLCSMCHQRRGPVFDHR